MRTMKKNGKRWLAMVLSLVMCFGLLQTTSFAANWSPGDKITINVRVYDESTGAVYNVGTDFPEYTTEEGAMVYGDFEFVGTAEGNWVPSGMFSCEGAVGE